MISWVVTYFGGVLLSLIMTSYCSVLKRIRNEYVKKISCSFSIRIFWNCKNIAFLHFCKSGDTRLKLDTWYHLVTYLILDCNVICWSIVSLCCNVFKSRIDDLCFDIIKWRFVVFGWDIIGEVLLLFGCDVDIIWWRIAIFGSATIWWQNAVLSCDIIWWRVAIIVCDIICCCWWVMLSDWIQLYVLCYYRIWLNICMC